MTKSNPYKLTKAIKFWISLLFLPFLYMALTRGGWWILSVPAYGWYIMAILDYISGLDLENPDPDTPEEKIKWHILVTRIWAPLQFFVLFGSIFYLTRVSDLATWEKWGVASALGIVTGTVGIVYAHELMHQKNRAERFMGDSLLGMVLYGHFRTEHLFVHHRYVGTPNDAATARYNENFYRFFARVLPESFISAWNVEKKQLAKKNLSVTDPTNPFWRYFSMAFGSLALAGLIGGWFGIGLFIVQAFTAIWQLELTNYVEHYGLTRKYLGNNKYESVKPRHSWNAPQRFTSYLLINLQRHSDHHYKPNRRFPLLQTYETDEAPQLPFGYPITNLRAMVPAIWRKRMNPRVRAWRQQFYPEITEWADYNKARNPRLS